MYRRGYDGVLLWCLEWKKKQIVMHTTHDGTYGGHFNGFTIIKHLIIMDYYWPTMERDYHDYVKYQQHVNLTHTPSQALQPIHAMWLFWWWGFELIGQFNPPSSKGHKFIIIATKYFIKWVEATPMVSTKGLRIIDFMDHNIISRFGIPMRIILDNRTNFKSKDIQSFYY